MSKTDFEAIEELYLAIKADKRDKIPYKELRNELLRKNIDNDRCDNAKRFLKNKKIIDETTQTNRLKEIYKDTSFEKIDGRYDTVEAWCIFIESIEGLKQTKLNKEISLLDSNLDYNGVSKSLNNTIKNTNIVTAVFSGLTMLILLLQFISQIINDPSKELQQIRDEIHYLNKGLSKKELDSIKREIYYLHKELSKKDTVKTSNKK